MTSLPEDRTFLDWVTEFGDTNSRRQNIAANPMVIALKWNPYGSGSVHAPSDTYRAKRDPKTRAILPDPTYHEVWPRHLAEIRAWIETDMEGVHRARAKHLNRVKTFLVDTLYLQKEVFDGLTYDDILANKEWSTQLFKMPVRQNPAAYFVDEHEGRLPSSGILPLLDVRVVADELPRLRSDMQMDADRRVQESVKTVAGVGANSELLKMLFDELKASREANAELRAALDAKKGK